MEIDCDDIYDELMVASKGCAYKSGCTPYSIKLKNEFVEIESVFMGQKCPRNVIIKLADHNEYFTDSDYKALFLEYGSALNLDLVANDGKKEESVFVIEKNTPIHGNRVPSYSLQLSDPIYDNAPMLALAKKTYEKLGFTMNNEVFTKSKYVGPELECFTDTFIELRSYDELQSYFHSEGDESSLFVSDEFFELKLMPPNNQTDVSKEFVSKERFQEAISTFVSAGVEFDRDWELNVIS